MFSPAFSSSSPLLKPPSSPSASLSRCNLLSRPFRFAPARLRRVSLRMAVHYLRPATLTWLLPVLPSVRQISAASSSSIDLYLLVASSLFVSGLGIVSLLPLLYPFVSAIVLNGSARSAPYAALLLGTIEHGAFLEGDRPSLPVAAPPSLHGVPAAALVLAHDPACSQVAAVQQVYVPSQERFLVSQSRIRDDRFLKLVQHAYEQI